MLHSEGTGGIASLSFLGRRGPRLQLESLYRFQGAPGVAPVLAREIGESEYTPSGFVCGRHHRSENVSLITECGTGQLYAVHVGSSDSLRAEGFEPGDFQTFWRLSRVVVVQGHARLQPVGTYLRKAHYGYCHGRSAGSAFVDPETRAIELLCHERAQQTPRRGPWRFWSATARPAPSVRSTAAAR